MLTISDYSQSSSLRPHMDEENISRGQRINHFRVEMYFDIITVKSSIGNMKLYEPNFQLKTTGCFMTVRNRNRKCVRRPFWVMDLFSVFLFECILAFASHGNRRLIVCVGLFASRNFTWELLLKTFLSHICHDLRLPNNTSETPCSGSFPHGFPTQFTWSLNAPLTDSVIVWILVG